MDIDDLHNRVPELRKDELRKLAEVGALNFIKDCRRSTVDGQFVVDGRRTTVDGQRSTVDGQFFHRRSALWQVERAARAVGPLLKEQKDQNSDSPLSPMTIEERVNADFRGTGLTIGRHPMAYRREELNKLGVKRAIDLREIRNGVWVRVAGWIIVRQRPGTAKGFLFLSMEDETGIANVIVTPDIFDRNRVVLVNQPLLLIEGPLQNQDNVIHVRARRIEPLSYAMAAAASHDFH
jgi:error-prone DNA polymerase